ncbi:MAG: hypothetical protein DRJ03_26085, partial [Chloroflexi bacterium]
MICPSGGIVHLKSGTYVIDDSILLYDNMIFEGDNWTTVIKLEDYVDWPLDKVFITNANNAAPPGNTNITLQNFKIDGNRANQFHGGGSGWYNVIVFGRLNGGLITNLWIINATNDGIRLREGCENITVSNNKMEYLGHAAIRIRDTNYITVYNNTGHDLGNSGLRISLCQNSNFYNNTFYNTSDAGIQLGGYSGHPLSNNNFYNNVLYHGAWGIWFSWIEENGAQNNSFYNNIIYDHNWEGIYIHGAKNTRFINNVIYDIKAVYGTGDGIHLTNLAWDGTP